MRLLALALLLSCDGTPPVPQDPCQGACDPAQLCVVEGPPACLNICRNELHCWSGCCLPVGDAGYLVCRPASVCFPG